MRTTSTIEWLAMLVFCVGTLLAQNADQDVKKATVKTGDAIGHTGKAIGKVTKNGAKHVGHGTKAIARDTAHGTDAGARDTAEGVKTPG